MLKKLKRFLRDTSGNFAVTSGIMLIPLMAGVGAAVDYTSYVNQKSKVQNSLDAAGLAAAKEYATGTSDLTVLEAYAKDFFETNLQGQVPPENYVFSFEFTAGDTSVEPPTEDSIKVSADLTYKVMFGSFLAQDTITNDIAAQVALGNRTVEMALVLDNSGSMGGNRLTTLKTEAKKLVDTIFESASLTSLPDPVKFSLVPFSGLVNVGNTNDNAIWMDTRGWSEIHHDNFDWENSYRTNNTTQATTKNGRIFQFRERIDGSWERKTRFSVLDMIGLEWAGCVEMRPWPYNITDLSHQSRMNYNNTRDAFDADGDGTNDGYNALFVPYFAPDEPDRDYVEGDGSNTFTVTDDDYYYNNYLYDFTDYKFDGSAWDLDDTIQLVVNPGDYDDEEMSADQETLVTDMHGSDNQVNRTNWMFKYQVADFHSGSATESTWSGPNFGCTSNAITDLTTSQTDIENALTAMNANGHTNIQQGLMWGWRTLSPGEPFTEGREYDDAHNMKFIVLLTDGNNFYHQDSGETPNQSIYGAWGYARPGTGSENQATNIFNGEATHNRWSRGLSSTDLTGTIYASTTFDETPESSSEFEAIMNAHTAQACENIKNSGITIFAVAFEVPSSGGVRDLLEACSGSGIKDGDLVMSSGEFYFDVDGEDLDETFKSIALQISNLRVSG